MGYSEPGAGVLASLVGDVDAFAGRHWGVAPLRGHTSELPPFGLEDVDVLLDSLLRAPAIRMVKHGIPLAPSTWTRPVRLGGVELHDVADPSKVVGAIADGATMVLQGVHRTWPPLAAFARCLEAEIGHPVQINAYLTPAGEVGLGRHADAHDVLVVQLFGSKHWQVESLGELVVGCGDVLYIPAGVRHDARATSEASLHLTIGIFARDLRSALGRLMRDVPALDAALPVAGAVGGEGEFGALVRGAVDALVATVAAMDDRALVATVAYRTPVRPHRRHAVRAVLDPTVVTPGASIQLRARCAVERSDAGWIVRGPERTLQLPPAAGPALTALAHGSPLRVEDLTGLDADSRLVLARRLIRERLAELVGHDERWP